MRQPLPLSSLADPRFIIALVLLVLNDAVWKDAYGNWVTGKLSDVVGLIVLPVVVAVVLMACRVPAHDARRAALGGVGAWFAVMKVWPPAADATEWLFRGLSGRPSSIVVDPTDLLGLVGLPIAAAVLRSPRPVIGSRQIRIALLMLGAFASLATSDSEYRTSDLYEVAETGEVVVHDTDPRYRNLSFPEGTTFEEAQAARSALEGGRGFGELATVACAKDESVCFRLDDGKVQRQTANGDWQTEWAVDVGPGVTAAAHGRQTLTDIMIDDDGLVYVAFPDRYPLIGSTDGTWSIPFQRFRSIAAAIGIILTVSVAMVTSIVSRRRAFTIICTFLCLFSVLTYISDLSDDGNTIEVFPAAGVANIAGLPAAILGLVAIEGSFRQPYRASIRQKPAPIDRPALLIAVGLVACAIAILVLWRSWLEAPTWLPMVSFGLAIGAIVIAAARRMHVAYQLSNGTYPRPPLRNPQAF